MSIQFLKTSSNPKSYKHTTSIETKAKLIQLDQCYLSLKEATKVRETSIEMMIKLMAKYSFNHDTLFIAISILDQLIEQNFTDPLSDPELIGGVLILLATKYNEVYPVVIDQINLNIKKYYDRQAFYQIEGLILEAINFQIPSATTYSEIYNSLVPVQELRKRSNKKQKSESSDTDDCSEQEFVAPYDRKNLGKELLQIVREPEVFKYGKDVLSAGLFSYFKNQKVKGLTSLDIKVHQIKFMIKKLIESQGEIETSKKNKMGGVESSLMKDKKAFTEKQILKNICCF